MWELLGLAAAGLQGWVVWTEGGQQHGHGRVAFMLASRLVMKHSSHLWMGTVSGGKCFEAM